MTLNQTELRITNHTLFINKFLIDFLICIKLIEQNKTTLKKIILGNEENIL